MTKFFLHSLCLLIFVLQCHVGLAANVGEQAPALEVVNSSNNTSYRLSDFKGKVVFVHFWSTWSQPDLEEMPSIQNLYNRFRNDARLQIVNILFRDDLNKALEYMTQNNFDYPLYLDSNNISATAYGVVAVPETYIIDKHGILKQKAIGATNWNTPDSISLISRLLDEPVDITSTRPVPPGSSSDKQAFGACGTLCGSFLFIIIAIFVLNIAILVWVAKDAKNRGMGSSVGWIFLILFTGIIGLIIYLFSRPKGELVICDVCKNKKFRVQKICPHCGNSATSVDVKADISSQTHFCKKCGSKVTDGASFCEKCGDKIANN